MADFTITVSNLVNVFGPQVADDWGTLSWTLTSAASSPGFTNWGYGRETQFDRIIKVLDNSVTVDSEVFKAPYTVVFEIFVVTGFDVFNEYLTDGSGWNYEAARPTTDFDSQVVSTWTSG